MILPKPTNRTTLTVGYSSGNRVDGDNDPEFGIPNAPALYLQDPSAVYDPNAPASPMSFEPPYNESALISGVTVSVDEGHKAWASPPDWNQQWQNYQQHSDTAASTLSDSSAPHRATNPSFEMHLERSQANPQGFWSPFHA
jgi:hypothetical protein